MRALIPWAWLVVLAVACSTQRRPVEQTPKTAVDSARPSGASYVNGEVLGVDNTAAGDHVHMTLRLQVEPGGSPPVQVRLGPGWYFTEHGIAFEPHEPVEVAGTHSHDEDGQSVIIAHELKKGGMTYRRAPDDEAGEWSETPAAAPETTDETQAPDEPADGAPATDESTGSPAAE